MNRLPMLPTPKNVATVMRQMDNIYLTLDAILTEATTEYGMDIDSGEMKALLRELYRKGRIEFKEVCGIQKFKLRPELQKLAWQATYADTGMFLDDRMRKTRRGRRMNPKKIVAWLNCDGNGVFSVNVVSTKLQVTHPIPVSITDLGDAVEWVCCHGIWVH